MVRPIFTREFINHDTIKNPTINFNVCLEKVGEI